MDVPGEGSCKYNDMVRHYEVMHLSVKGMLGIDLRNHLIVHIRGGAGVVH
jgi:hypothetical protein